LLLSWDTSIFDTIILVSSAYITLDKLLTYNRKNNGSSVMNVKIEFT